jgi:hypothetical protein
LSAEKRFGGIAAAPRDLAGRRNFKRGEPALPIRADKK